MIQKKLKSKKGMTMSEMLVALAVFALLSAAVLSGILNAVPVYQESVAISESQLLTSTLSQAISDELRFAKDVETEADTTLKSYTSTLYGKDAKIEISDKGAVLVNGNPIISSGSYTNLQAETLITYVDGTFDITITISQGTVAFNKAKFSVSAVNV